jgi:DmsE family decaheme c-type cytochrome
MSLSATTRRSSLLFSLRWLGIVALVVVSVGLLAAARPAVQEKDADTCGVCHEDLVTAFAQKAHTVIGEKSCTSCHGSAEKHVEEEGEGGVFAFGSSDLPQDKSAKCLTCHSKDNPQYAISPHAKAALDCTTCHSVHGDTDRALLKTGVNKNCAVCHQDVFAQFQTNERHRLQEGIMTCTTCHDPHEPATRSRLGGFKDEQCIRCHNDKGGPFLYEHEASQVEGCTSCHEVHGSSNRHMLTHQSTADLCFSCHGTAPSWHGYFSSQDTNCVTCHATIHGSNLDRRFLK